jgi:hypothetical protein
LEVRWWILFPLSAIAVGVGIELKRQAVVAVICDHIFSDYTCKLCKPTEIISFFGHCGCDSDPWQCQITTEIGFITTMWMPACTVNHLRRTRSQCLLMIKEMVLNFLKSS